MNLIGAYNRGFAIRSLFGVCEFDAHIFGATLQFRYYRRNANYGRVSCCGPYNNRRFTSDSYRESYMRGARAFVERAVRS